MKRKIFAALLAVMMVVSMLPLSVMAAETQTYRIKYVAGDGECVYTGTEYSHKDNWIMITYTYGEEQALYDGAGFEHEGYTLTDWVIDKTEYEPGETVKQTFTSTKNGLVTATPVWTPNTYTIKYNAGEGEYTGSLPNSKPEWLQLKNAYTYDSAVTLYDGENFERTGYALTGWEIGGTEYDLGETVEKNFTKVQSGTVQAYAVWTPITYTIKYNAGEGEYTGSLPNSKPEWLQLKNAYTYDSAVTLYDGEDFERTGYALTGWEIGGTEYALGETVEKNFTSVQSGTVQAYAVWTPITYTIKYNAGEGEYTGSLPNSKPEWLQLKNAYTYDSAVTLYDGEDFERTGYTLTGWEIGGTKYDLGETVEQNFTKVQSGTVQAYAVWEPIGYTLRFNADTGLINGKRLFTTSPNYIVTDNMSLEEIFAWENEAGFIDSPDVEVSKEGYELKYWYCTANNKIKVYPGGKFDIGTFVENGCDVNEDGIPMIKFKAVWDASDVTVEYTFATEADRELPSEVTALVPVDENVYHAGDIVTVPTLAATTVETEEGTWTFVDWNLKEGATEFTVQPKDAENGILITGYWSFTEKVEEPETEEEPKPEKPEPKFDMPKLNLRSIVIDTTEGGKTSVASGRCYGALGSTYRLAITPDEGFEIDEVLVNGKPAEVNKNNKASFVVKGNTYVEVSFVEIEG